MLNRRHIRTKVMQTIFEMQLTNNDDLNLAYKKLNDSSSSMYDLYLLQYQLFIVILQKARKLNKNFWIDYSVFKDLRTRGYIVKTALKFGADFRVYDRGVKPGQDHAKWVMFPIAESASCSWHEFAAKNRVAHSTRKRLLIAIVDEEGDVTYYSIAWTRP